MEKNRTLWIIFSVSLFLVVVLAGGLYFLRPSAGEKMAAVKPLPSVQGFDTYEYVRGRTELPGLEPSEKKPQEMEIVVGEKEGKKPVEQPLPAPEKKAEPKPRPVEAVSAKPALPVQKPQKPVPKPQRVTEYWIQTGSYQSRSRAEMLVQTLGDKGLSAALTTREVEGESYFRVRIGPYLSRQEADKFLAWIRQMEGFEASYISQVLSTRGLLP